ncbi:YciI family protein [Komagataeibacter sp. FNDCF1]|uniref:YciI family protein n=1 Tax=Komagataeibacter sp. FNDCF1 TaxID=2878681 RepID=UPI001E5429A1|nr:YciI family protein [Komagataeibacter sp. FNDCF1]MCE2564437.1 YciI family protein [Komagataeibacter sp. FNDCF1]
MLFAIICTDRPASLETRKATRERHLAYLERWKQHVVHGGPLLDAENRPCGSLLVVDVADRAAAEGFAVEDPYAKVDLFESVVIRPFRSVFRDGLRVE